MLAEIANEIVVPQMNCCHVPSIAFQALNHVATAPLRFRRRRCATILSSHTIFACSPVPGADVYHDSCSCPERLDSASELRALIIRLCLVLAFRVPAKRVSENSIVAGIAAVVVVGTDFEDRFTRS